MECGIDTAPTASVMSSANPIDITIVVGRQLSSAACIGNRPLAFEILTQLFADVQIGPASQPRVRNYQSEESALQFRFFSGGFPFIEWSGNPYGL